MSGLSIPTCIRRPRGWPDYLRDTGIVVTVKVGFDIDETEEDLINAIILMTRQFYESPERMEADFAVHALIAPWMRFNG